MQLSITTELPGADFDEVEKVTREILADHGFGILTEIDVKATMKKKLDKEFQKYKILGACNPPRAYKVLTEDPEMGIFLPCNVVLYQDDDKVIVKGISPKAMFQMIENEKIEEVALEVEKIFEIVIDSIAKKFK